MYNLIDISQPIDFRQAPSGDCGGGNTCGIIGDWDGKGVPVTRCVARRWIGQACISHWQCGMLDAVCLAGTCSPWPASGQPCIVVGGVGYCGVQKSCESGTCAAYPSLGQLCNYLCGTGLACRADKATGAKTCVLHGQLGAPCDSPFECGSTLSCSNGTCYQPLCP